MKNNKLINRKGVSTKVVREFLADPKWSKDDNSTNLLTAGDKVYRHSDNHVLVVFWNGRGMLYETKESFEHFLDHVKQIGLSKPTHILKDRLLYGEDFVQHIPDLIEQLSKTLKIPQEKLDKSMMSLNDVQIKVKRIGRSKCLEAPVFAELVAYIGEVIIVEIVGAQWQMRLSDQDSEVWEPWIVDSEGRSCNPWSYLYDMLAEPSVPISLMGAASIPINNQL